MRTLLAVIFLSGTIEFSGKHLDYELVAESDCVGVHITSPHGIHFYWW